jgi:glycosyltransferase involved in cell wall biosynthesis
MKLLFIAGREPSYARVNILLKGLQQNNVDLKKCLCNSKNPFVRYITVVLKFIFLRKKDCDAIFIGFFGQPLVPFIRLFTRKKIIFDAFLSAYDTMVFDRKKVKKKSILARFFYYLDKLSCRLADKVLVDTYQHIDYFVSEFDVPRNKMEKVAIGADDALFHPMKYKPPKRKRKNFIVEFHGNFIPLQGAEYIIRAANKLRGHADIKFILIGGGQTLDKCVSLAKKYELRNVDFLGKKKQRDIPRYISMGDIGLGIFGSTKKTLRVIPNKAYEILAMKRPLLTSDTPAAAELLTNRGQAYLCKVADPDSLAKAILYLKKDNDLRNKIAQNGHKLFNKKCTPLVLGRELKRIIQNMI